MMMASLKTLMFGKKNRIARRLIVLIIAFSSMITLVISAVQLAFEYRELRSGVDRALDGIGIFVPNISGSVWNFDEAQIRLALDALQQLPNVDWASVRISGTDARWTIGNAMSGHVVTRTYPLRQRVRGVDTEIGMLEVAASLDPIYRQVAERALTIILSNGLKTFLVALFMLYLFRRQVSSRLEQLARKVSAMGPQPAPAQNAENGPRPIPARLDELDAVDWAIDNATNELKRAEAQQRLAASVFSHTQEAITITDADANIVSVNRRFGDLTGYSADETIGRNPRMLKSGRQGGDFYRTMWASILADGYWAGELWNRRKDGGVFPGWLSISAVRDECGRVTNYVGVLVDISRRVDAEQALRESEHLYRTMFDSAPVGVWMLGPDRLTTAVNQRMCDLIGYAREDMLGRDAVEFADEVNGRIFQKNAALVLSRQTRTYEAALRCRDGSSIPTEFNVASLFNEDGSVRAILAFVVDLSARKQHESELQRMHEDLEQRVVERTRALEAANRELEAFSYAVSHDLRAPLRAIEGFSSLIEKEYEAQLDERGRNYFQRVRGGAARMGRLIDDLLKLSRISRQEMHRGPVNLSALAHEAVDELRGTEPERRVECVIAPQVMAEGDSGLLRIALQNLIGNAWKYSSKRELAHIEFGVCRWNDRPAFFVRDDGEGFDMAYSNKLFSAFQRLHTEKEFPGTGIGLATVARIIRRHGGTVGADSRPHQGATFYFTL